MNKKAYIIPAVVTVGVATEALIAASLKLDKSTENQITDQSDILTKEESAWDIWDN